MHSGRYKQNQPGCASSLCVLKEVPTQQPEHTACVDRQTMGITVSDLPCSYSEINGPL